MTESTCLVRTVELQHLGASGLFELGSAFERHRLATGEHRTKRREIAGTLRLRVEHHDELRAHAAQHRDALTLDEIKGRIGIKAFHHHCRAAEDGGREMRGPETKPVWGREHSEEHLIGTETSGRRRKVMEVEPAVLGVHHTLGQTRGSRGGVEQEERIGIEWLHRRTGVDDHIGGQTSVDDLRLAVHEHKAVDLRAQCSHIGHQLRGITTVLIGCGDQHRGAGECEEMGDLAISCACPDADGHQTGLLDTDEHRVHGGAVGHHDRDSIATAMTTGEQNPGDSIRISVVLGPGVATSIGDVRERVGHRGCVPRHNRGNGVVAPPARSSVGRSVGGISSVFGDHSKFRIIRVQ